MIMLFKRPSYPMMAWSLLIVTGFHSRIIVSQSQLNQFAIDMYPVSA